ncbi:hypothetical protein GHT06_004559 [Daphnia sinensis]|uniref:Tyr recombinase domain-containing protein n=1 Tax=Daphnia sinensis TaxID=1820382 RepID=A0AAD5PLI0_9CRUS|nr:hypothetical protein GHT06_004559 [Daphnia sinensis]
MGLHFAPSSEIIPEKFVFKKRISGRLAKWVVKGIPEKQVKAAREAFKPSTLPIGGEDLFGDAFIRELLAQVQTAALVNISVAPSPPAGPSNPDFSQRYHDNNRFFCPRLFDFRIAGRASHFVDGWTQLSLDPWVLSTISSGFKLDFFGKPPFQRQAPSNATMDAFQFSLCGEEVDTLITKGAVVEAGEEAGCISRYRHFKMEGIVTVRHTVRQGDFMAKIDLTDAYFTIPNKIFEYTCLPFGLSSSPWVFTKLLRVPVAFLHDILVVGATFQECIASVKKVISTLESLGFLINFKKSVTTPSQCIEYIGLITASLAMSFRLTDKKIADISRLCKEALKKGKCSLRAIAKILGNLNWATYAVRFAPAHYRHLQALLISASKNNNDDLDVIVSLDSAALSDLTWWVNEANFSKGKGLLSTRSDVYFRTSGPWTSSELDMHINSLELLPALKALECFTSSVRDCSVVIEVDNTTAVSYINKLGGCKSKSLCSIALRIAHCRHRIETGPLFRRLDAVPSCVQKHPIYLGSPSGPFRVRMEPPTPSFRELVSPTTSMESGRIQLQLERPERILLPPVQFNSLRSYCYSILAEPTLVPDGHGTLLRHPSDPPSDTEQFGSANRVATIRCFFQERGLSESAINLVLASSRKNTVAAYQSAWNAWRSWCFPRNQDPLSASPTVVANFLADFSVKRSYSSVNVARSMLSSTLSLKPGSVDSVGKDPLVVNLLKGLYNNSPSTPKYIATWNPDTVLSFFIRKCVTLIALCSLLRTCEIASILLDSVSISDSKLSFTLGRQRKTQHSGPLKQFSIDSWPANIAICPVYCVNSYMERTAELRATRNSSSLFISSTKPHSAVSPSTVGRWIKDQLGLAGIDTSSFTAHSTRGAAASKAARSGLPIQTILDHGHWARESTFARFYHRETVVGSSNPVGSSVLRV